MFKHEITREFAGTPANDCYQACLRAVQSAGYKIVKKRDIASLAICQSILQGSLVDLSLMVPLGKPTRVILTISSERADEISLRQEADRVLGIVGNELGRR